MLRRDFMHRKRKKNTNIHTHKRFYTYVIHFDAHFFSANAGKIGVLLLHVNIDKRDRKWSDAQISVEIDEMPKHRTNIDEKKRNHFQWLRREYIII